MMQKNSSSGTKKLLDGLSSMECRERGKGFTICLTPVNGMPDEILGARVTNVELLVPSFNM